MTTRDRFSDRERSQSIRQGSSFMTQLSAAVTELVPLSQLRRSTPQAQCRPGGNVVHEPFGMFGVGVEQDRLTSFINLPGSSTVDIGWSLSVETGETMIFVALKPKSSRLSLSVFETTDSIGKIKPALEGSMLTLGVKIVATAKRTAVGCTMQEIRQKVRDYIGDH
ncbi:MAG: hypothetical protein ACP5O0_09405 [Acidimicrobiales bacterium]